MREVTRYQCETCGALYEKADGAYNCPHLHPICVRGYSFTEGLVFPEFVKVEFNYKGTEVCQTYRLDMLANASKKGNYYEKTGSN